MVNAVSDKFGDQQSQVEDRFLVLVERQGVDRAAGRASRFDASGQEQRNFVNISHLLTVPR